MERPPKNIWFYVKWASLGIIFASVITLINYYFGDENAPPICFKDSDCKITGACSKNGFCCSNAFFTGIDPPEGYKWKYIESKYGCIIDREAVPI